MAKRKPKVMRPKALPPRGFRDYFGADVQARANMLGKITDIYHAYGFDPLETPAVETVEALGKFLPDVDRPNDGVFAWQDEDESWLALRYDLTAPLARVYAQFRNDLPTPYRRYAVGPVWRNEKPGPGRFRQFYQCDADTVGTPTVAADAEICMMLSDALEAAGIARNDYIVRVNNRKVLNGVMEVAGVLDPSDPTKFESQRGIVLRAIDKLDRLGLTGVMQLLGEQRVDESGDITRGANLSMSQAEIIHDFLDAKQATNEKTLSSLRNVVGNSAVGLEGVSELEQISETMSAQDYGSERFNLDPTVVRGLGYYTGPVYEAELTFDIIDEKGAIRQFGSVAGGGRYDDLVKRFTGQAVPATGVSIGVDRLRAALAARGKAETTAKGPVVITVMDRERMGDYQAMVAELRGAGIRAEVYLGNPKNFGNQLKYADARNAPVAVIEGGDEHEKGVVQIKDLALGKALATNITSNEEWKSQPAQMEIKRGDLVTQVRKMMGRANGE